MNNNKSKTIYCHANRRCKQRFNVSLKRSEQRSIVSLIQQSKAVFIERQSNRITLWLVNYKEKAMRVVYDKHRKLIVTVLPCGGEDIAC